MKLLLLSLLFSAAALPADPAPAPPAPPECLTRPVTLGNVTLSCSLIDNTGNPGSDQGLFGAGAQYVFQVRIISSDPDVSGIRVGVSSLWDTGSTVKPSIITTTEWRSISKTCSSSTLPLVAGCAAPGPYVYRYSMWVNSPAITSIQIEETKSVSSQTF